MKRIRLKELAECLECTIGLVSNWENSRGRTWNETFGYDGMGNITSINRNGVSSTYTYDKLNRIDVETVPGLVKNYDYDSRGNIQSIQRNGTSYTNTYDSADRLQSANTPNGPLSYTYDNRGNRLTAAGNGTTSTYTYNAQNELKTYMNTVTGATYGYTYYPDGLRATKGTVGGSSTRYVYLNGKVIEELGSQGNVKARNIWGNELLYRQDFTANQLSNGSFETPSSPAWSLGTGQVVTGGIDGTHTVQFTNATTTNTGAVQWLTNVTAGKPYVVEGSIKTQNVVGSGAFIWISYLDASMHEVGNYWLGVQTGTKDWTRSSITVTPPAGTTSMYIGTFLYNSSGTAWFDDIQVTEVGDPAQKAGYYFYNGHGDVVAVKDSSGNTLNTYEYDIWGNLTSKTEAMPQPFRYAGEPQDGESGLIYLRARYYDPAVARFLTEDTYTGQIDNPLSLNLYTYVHNNPLTHWDPSGHGPFGRAAAGLAESVGAALGGASSMPGSMPGAPYPIVTPLKDPEGSNPYVDKKILPNLPSAYTSQWEVSQPYIQVDQQTAKENFPTVIQQPVVDSSMYILASSSSPLQNGLALSKIAGKYGNLKCVEAAKDMKSYLTKNGLKGEQISVRYDSKGFIVSDSYGTEAISENGYHTGILYEGKVYDNIHPDGMPYQQWLDDLYGVGNREVTSVQIN